MTIGRQLTLGFASVSIIVLAVIIWISWEVRIAHESAENLSKAHLKASILASRIDQNFLSARNHFMFFALAKKSSQLAQGKGKMEEARNDLDALSQLATTHPALEPIRAKIVDLNEQYKNYYAQVEKIARMSDNNISGVEFDNEISEWMTMGSRLVDISESISRITGENAAKGGETTSNDLSNISRHIIIGAAVAIILSTFFNVILTKKITAPLIRVTDSLSESADHTMKASGQVSSASQSLAEGANEQAASIEETSASLEEIAGMTQNNADNAQKAKSLATQTKQAAETGVSDMRHMSSAMDEIQKSSDDISKIIKTIDEIAFQTNILALNAAVEAARAGDAGMGFAVVADEVRNLAQRSAVAAKETSNKIQDAAIKSRQGVEMSDKVGKSLNEISTLARQVDEIVAEINSSCREQTQGISQISQALNQMDSVTQRAAASAEETASSAEQLNSQALDLREVSATLLEMVHGKGTANPLPLQQPTRHSTLPKKAIAKSRTESNFRLPPSSLKQRSNGVAPFAAKNGKDGFVDASEI